MNKWHWLLIVVFAGWISLLPGAAMMRLELSSPFLLDVNPKDRPELKFSYRHGKQEMLVVEKELHDKEWTPIEFTFVPRETGTVRLSLRLKGKEGELEQRMFVDDFEAIGTKLRNGDFEKLSPDGSFAAWTGSPENVVTEPVRNGRYAGSFTLSKRLTQRIAVDSGKPVTLKYFVRRDELKLPPAPPGTNQVYDHITGEVVVISSGRIDFRPTYENCGVYINRSPEEIGKELELKLFYREAGSSEWLPALVPAEIRQENAWRGSIFQLRENTGYEVKAEIGGEVVTGQFRTLNSNIQVAETIELDPAKFPGKLEITRSGKPDGYIRYTMKPGAALKGDPKKDAFAVITVKDARYILLDGLEIDANRAQWAINIDKASDVVIRNCDLSRFGRVGSRRRDLDGTFRTADGIIVYDDGGIRLTNCQRILVERCYIHHPEARSNSWFYAHPAGPDAILVSNTEQVVLRYNDFAGNDEHRFIDCVQGPVNNEMNGGFKRDADIYGNLMIFSNDDAIELEGGEMNVRVYLNRFEGNFTGVSTGVARLGPSYQIRNLYTRSGDERGLTGATFKNGIKTQGYGTIYVFNNTIGNQQPYSAFSGFHPSPPIPEVKPVIKAVTRNNIIRAVNNFFGQQAFEWPVDADYDLLAGPETAKGNLAELGQEKHAIFAEPQFIAPERGDFRLKPSSPGYRSGANLPNIVSVHAGAFQDDGIEALPYRPVPVTADPKELYFESENSPLEQSFRITVGGENFKRAFTVKTNDDFFTVTPAQGTFESGKELEFTVRLHPGKMPLPKRYNGVLLLRDELGYSVPVTVYADYQQSPTRQEKVLRQAIRVPVNIDGDKRQYSGQVNIPENGIYYVLAAVDGVDILSGFVLKFGDTVTDSRGRIHVRNHYMPITRGALSAYVFKLEAGSQPLSLEVKNRDVRISELLIVREPELYNWR